MPRHNLDLWIGGLWSLGVLLLVVVLVAVIARIADRGQTPQVYPVSESVVPRDAAEPKLSLP